MNRSTIVGITPVYPNFQEIASMSVPAGAFAVFGELKIDIAEANTGTSIDAPYAYCQMTAGALGSVGFLYVGNGAIELAPPHPSGTFGWSTGMTWPATMHGAITIPAATSLYLYCSRSAANTALIRVRAASILAIRVGTVTVAP